MTAISHMQCWGIPHSAQTYLLIVIYSVFSNPRFYVYSLILFLTLIRYLMYLVKKTLSIFSMPLILIYFITLYIIIICLKSHLLFPSISSKIFWLEWQKSKNSQQSQVLTRMWNNCMGTKKWHNHFRKLEVSYEIKHTFTLRCSNPTSEYSLERNATYVHTKTTCGYW